MLIRPQRYADKTSVTADVRLIPLTLTHPPPRYADNTSVTADVRLIPFMICNRQCQTTEDRKPPSTMNVRMINNCIKCVGGCAGR